MKFLSFFLRFYRQKYAKEDRIRRWLLSANMRSIFLAYWSILIHFYKYFLDIYIQTYIYVCVFHLYFLNHRLEFWVYLKWNEMIWYLDIEYFIDQLFQSWFWTIFFFLKEKKKERKGKIVKKKLKKIVRYILGPKTM